MKKKKIRKPGFTGEFGEQLEKTVEKGKEQVLPRNFIEEILEQLFGQAKPVPSEKIDRIKQEEEEEARKARAQVLRQFMGPSEKEEERVYYQKQKEEAVRKIEERKKAQEEAKEKMVKPPKGRKKIGSLFEHLRRKVTKAERKGGKF